MNRQTFFSYVRKAPFGGKLSTAQVQGMEAVLDEWENRKLTDDRWLAYILATDFHETGGRMQPVRETFANSDAQAIARLDAAYASGKLKSVKTPYWRDGWFGRGLVQITHEDNYRKMGVSKADALKLGPAVRVLFDGMIDGDFTGKKLDQFFNGNTNDPVGARKIVNGKDKAKLIAQYHGNFLDAITAAKEPGKAPAVVVEEAKPDDVPPAKSKSLWAILLAIFTGGGAGVIGQISENGSKILNAVNNPWAALSLLSIVGGGVLIWMLATGRLQQFRSKSL